MVSKDREQEVASPCISVCALSVDDVCVGCYRSAEEISQWFDCDNEQKQKILKQSDRRAHEAGAYL